jgi:hypothetical protein
MNDLATNLRASAALQPTLASKTLMEVALLELENRPRGGNFPLFCAAKWELNDRGFMCAACSIHHHALGADAPYRCSPCADCKGKKPIPPNDIPIIVPTETPSP